MVLSHPSRPLPQGKTLLLGLYEAHEAIMRGARKEDIELQNVGTTTFLGGLCVELSSEEARLSRPCVLLCVCNNGCVVLCCVLVCRSVCECVCECSSVHRAICAAAFACPCPNVSVCMCDVFVFVCVCT